MGEPKTLIRIHEAKARLYFVTSEFERSAAEGERILPLARLTGNRLKEAEALATIAWASTWGRISTRPFAFRAKRCRGRTCGRARRAGTGALHHRLRSRCHWRPRREPRGPRQGHRNQHRRWRRRSISRCRCRPPGCCETGPAITARPRVSRTEGLALARECGLLLPLLFNCFLRGLTLTGKGDYDEALASFTEGLSLAERVGDEAIHHRLLNCLGWLYADLGDLDHAEELNATSARIGRRRSDPGTQPNAELNLAEIFRAEGIWRGRRISTTASSGTGRIRRESVDAVPVFDPHVRRHG